MNAQADCLHLWATAIWKTRTLNSAAIMLRDDSHTDKSFATTTAQNRTFDLCHLVVFPLSSSSFKQLLLFSSPYLLPADRSQSERSILYHRIHTLLAHRNSALLRGKERTAPDDPATRHSPLRAMNANRSIPATNESPPVDHNRLPQTACARTDAPSRMPARCQRA